MRGVHQLVGRPCSVDEDNHRLHGHAQTTIHPKRRHAGGITHSFLPAFVGGNLEAKSRDRLSSGDSVAAVWEEGVALNCGSEGWATVAHDRSLLHLDCLLKMVYHSSVEVDPETQLACSCPLLPLKSHIRGPAPTAEPGSTDIIDEAINFFRANVLFRKFEVKGPADKLLVYLTLYINMALKRIEACKTEADGVKAIITLGLEKFPLPGEPGFPLGGLFTTPQTKDEGELIRNYIKQVREETSGRLMEKVYRQNGTPNKWWLAFAKRKFTNIMMPL